MKTKQRQANIKNMRRNLKVVVNNYHEKCTETPKKTFWQKIKSFFSWSK